MIRRQIVHHPDLSRLQGRAKDLKHRPLEYGTIDGPFDDQRGHRPPQPQRTDQGVILAPVPWDSGDGALVTGRTSVTSCHAGVEAALIEEDQPFRSLEQGRESGEELRLQFLTLLGRDPRFFYT